MLEERNATDPIREVRLDALFRHFDCGSAEGGDWYVPREPGEGGRASPAASSDRVRARPPLATHARIAGRWSRRSRSGTCSAGSRPATEQSCRRRTRTRSARTSPSSRTSTSNPSASRGRSPAVSFASSREPRKRGPPGRTECALRVGEPGVMAVGCARVTVNRTKTSARSTRTAFHRTPSSSLPPARPLRADHGESLDIRCLPNLLGRPGLPAGSSRLRPGGLDHPRGSSGSNRRAPAPRLRLPPDLSASRPLHPLLTVFVCNLISQEPCEGGRAYRVTGLNGEVVVRQLDSLAAARAEVRRGRARQPFSALRVLGAAVELRPPLRHHPRRSCRSLSLSLCLVLLSV